MLRTGSGVTVPKNSQIYRKSRVYIGVVNSWANRVPIDTKTEKFQYKFVNDLLSNRHWLKKWKIVNSGTCFYCKAHDENITHMFWTCSHTKNSFGRISLTFVAGI